MNRTAGCDGCGWDVRDPADRFCNGCGTALLERPAVGAAVVADLLLLVLVIGALFVATRL